MRGCWSIMSPVCNVECAELTKVSVIVPPHNSIYSRSFNPRCVYPAANRYLSREIHRHAGKRQNLSCWIVRISDVTHNSKISSLGSIGVTFGSAHLLNGRRSVSKVVDPIVV